MNAMGPDMPDLAGVDHRGVARKINDLVPGYMVMGDRSGSMGDMRMRLPQNILPMMDGKGPFGNIEMGGMFTVLKVREGLARGITGTRAGTGIPAARWRASGPATCRRRPPRPASRPRKAVR